MATVGSTVTAESTSVEAMQEIADAAPIGFAAQGLTMLLLSVINAGWIGANAAPGVLAVAVPFGGVGQGLAGMWAFRRGNTFAATIFTSYSAFWLSYWMLLTFFVGDIARVGGQGDVRAFLGAYLMAWGLFSVCMFLASLALSKGVQIALFLLAATFGALCIGEWRDSPSWHHVGGYVGIAAAIAANWVSFGTLTTVVRHRATLLTDFKLPHIGVPLFLARRDAGAEVPKTATAVTRNQDMRSEPYQELSASDFARAVEGLHFWAVHETDKRRPVVRFLDGSALTPQNLIDERPPALGDVRRVSRYWSHALNLIAVSLKHGEDLDAIVADLEGRRRHSSET